MPRPKPKHVPVLLSEVLQYLNPARGESYLDATAGYGGHAAAVIDATSNEPGAVLIDRDAQARDSLKRRFGAARVVKSDFLEGSRTLADQGLRFDMILADLGVSSPHFDETHRGFSFGFSGPLDMRMDQSQTLAASEIVNRWSRRQLSQIFSDYGQEPKADRIARQIIRARPISTTTELATAIAKAWPKASRHHPATRVFQAIRIAVNDELGQLEKALPIWLELLKDGGRLVIISYHSLEDGLVKRFFAEQARAGWEAQLKILTKKPVQPSADEISINQRARSARLRAASKINNKKKGHVSGNVDTNNGTIRRKKLSQSKSSSEGSSFRIRLR